MRARWLNQRADDCVIWMKAPPGAMCLFVSLCDPKDCVGRRMDGSTGSRIAHGNGESGGHRLVPQGINRMFSGLPYSGLQGSNGPHDVKFPVPLRCASTQFPSFVFLLSSFLFLRSYPRLCCSFLPVCWGKEQAVNYCFTRGETVAETDPQVAPFLASATIGPKICLERTDHRPNGDSSIINNGQLKTDNRSATDMMEDPLVLRSPDPASLFVFSAHPSPTLRDWV